MDAEDAGMSVLGWAVEKFRSHANQSTDRLREADEQERRSWVYARNKHIEARLAELERRAYDEPDLTRRLEALLADLQFWRVQRNYEFEATREATDERRRLLEFASAGAVNAELTIAQIARVERSMRELDPDDVKLLHRLASIEEVGRAQGMAFSPSGQQRYNVFRDAGVCGEMLIASGCVRVDTPNAYDVGPEVYVTQIGLWVIKVCEPYLRATEPTQPTLERPTVNDATSSIAVEPVDDADGTWG